MLGQAAVLGGSAAVVALMVGMAWLLGFRGAARIDHAELSRLLALAEPGAQLADEVIAVDGRAALARVNNGKLLVARSMGNDVSVRLYPMSAVTLCLADKRVVATFADIGFPTLNMRLEHDPPPWLGALAAGVGGSL